MGCAVAVSVHGGVFLLAFWISGNPGARLVPFGVMVGYGALLLIGGRIEVVRVLRGQPTDEMWASFNVRAILFSFFVLVAVMIGAGVYEMARGQDAQPYALLCLVGGASYIGALIWFRLRS